MNRGRGVDRVLPYLKLLLRGVSQEELIAETRSAVERGDLPADGADDLCDLNRRLARSKLREDQLRVLHDTATDLGHSGDVEEVLFAIVRRVRILTGSDIGYIALNDLETNEVYIRKCDGVNTEAYRTLRLPIGIGVIGRAATGIAPFTTSDYLDDPTFDHLSFADRAVRGEGVRSILAVPMNLRGKVIGALLISDRSPRQYTSEMFELVDTLAKHASVALDNVQRFSNVNETLKRLSEEQRTGTELLEAVSALVELDDHLITRVTVGDGLDGLLQLAARVFSAKVTILDAAHGVLATTKAPAENSEEPSDPNPTLIGATTRETIDRAFALAEPQVYAEDGFEQTIACSEVAGNHYATLIVRKRLDTAECALLKRLVAFLPIAKRLDLDLDANRANKLLQSALMDALLRDGEQTQETKRRATRYGISSGEPVMVLTISAHSADPARIESAIVKGLGARTALISQHITGNQDHTHTCVIASGYERIANVIRYELEKRSIEAVIGRAGPVLDLASIPAAHIRAERGMSALLGTGVRNGMLDGDMLGATGALLDACRTPESRDALTAAIRPLLDYDRTHGTELTMTAWTFLDSESNAVRTAEELFIHRNTVRQRLAQIDRLVPDWRERPRRLDMQIALQTWQLTTGSQRTSTSVRETT